MCGLKFLPRTPSEIAGHIDHEHYGCTLYFQVLLLLPEGRFPESCSMKLNLNESLLFPHIVFFILIALNLDHFNEIIQAYCLTHDRTQLALSITVKNVSKAFSSK